MHPMKQYVAFWCFGVTFLELGFWIGIPHHVVNGPGFKSHWRPFGFWKTSTPFGWMR